MVVSPVAIRIRSNAKRVTNRLEKDIKRMVSDGKKTTREVAEYGKNYAQQIAPAKTGLTIRAIKWTKGKTPSSATIIFGDGHPEIFSRKGGAIRGNGGTGGLTWFMNYGHDVDVWTSGEPRFISKTVQEVEKRFNRKVRRVINSFVK